MVASVYLRIPRFLALERTQKKAIEQRQLAIYCRRRTTKMEIPASVEE